MRLTQQPPSHSKSLTQGAHGPDEAMAVLFSGKKKRPVFKKLDGENPSENARNLILQQDWDQAELCLLESIIEAEKDVPKNKLGLIRDYNNLGYTYYKSGKLQDAQDCFRQALEIAHKTGESFSVNLGPISFNMGKLLVEQGLYEKAEGYLKDALTYEKGALRLLGEKYHTLVKSQLTATLKTLAHLLRLTKRETEAEQFESKVKEYTEPVEETIVAASGITQPEGKES